MTVTSTPFAGVRVMWTLGPSTLKIYADRRVLDHGDHAPAEIFWRAQMSPMTDLAWYSAPSPAWIRRRDSS